MSPERGVGNARAQVTRLLALVPYLQKRGSVPVEEVARDFGVTAEVIRKDVKVLIYCGLPGLGMGDLIDIDFDAFEGEGVIRLSNADYLARPLRLDSTEAAALVVGLRALLEGSSEDEREVVQRALSKIEEAAGDAAAAASHVELRTAVADDEQALARQLSAAAAEGRQVRLRHWSPVRDEVTERVVDPIAVTTAEGHAYLDAWCHAVEDRRLFRLDRVESAETLESPVTEQARLEPLDLSAGIFQRSPDDLLATVRLLPEARWVAEYHPVESVTEEGDGTVTVTMRVGDPAWLVRLLLRLGGAAALVEPVELAAEVRAAARAALDLYR